MRLKKAQRSKLLSWISDGLTSDEINEKAAVFKPPFVVTRQNVSQYRKRWDIRIDTLREESDYAAINEGLARQSERVMLLRRLANHMVEDLFERKLFWTTMVKGIGSTDNYERVEYEEFNAAEVTQLRGVLDDIAKEVGGRVQNLVIGGKLNVIGFETLLNTVYGNKKETGSR